MCEPERPVGVQVAAGADRAQLAGLRRAHQLAPVAVHLGLAAGAPPSASTPVKSASSEVPGPPHSCTAAMPSDAARAQRGHAGRRGAAPGVIEPSAIAAHHVVRVAAQPARLVVPGRATTSGVPPPAARWSTAPSGCEACDR